MINFIKSNKPIILLIIFVFLLVPIILAVFPREGNKNGEKQNASPTPGTGQVNKISPLQRVVVGKKPDVELDKLPNFLSKVALPGGQTQYNYESQLNNRSNQIITSGGKVIFERELTPENPTTPGYATISQVKAQFGEPDRVIKGSKFYGFPLEQYIYSKKGFAMVANPYNNEVYEFSFFTPMSVEEYVSKYGDDITSASGPNKEQY